MLRLHPDFFATLEEHRWNIGKTLVERETVGILRSMVFKGRLGEGREEETGSTFSTGGGICGQLVEQMWTDLRRAYRNFFSSA